jgi:hypothetical protein
LVERPVRWLETIAVLLSAAALCRLPASKSKKVDPAWDEVIMGRWKSPPALQDTPLSERRAVLGNALAVTAYQDGKPVDAARHENCLACHEARVKDRDFVFARYAP